MMQALCRRFPKRGAHTRRAQLAVVYGFRAFDKGVIRKHGGAGALAVSIPDRMNVSLAYAAPWLS